LQIEGLRRDLFFSGPPEALEPGRLHAAEYLTAPECDLLLPEDVVGVPPIIDVPRPLTSTNRLWNTHYLARFERATGHLLGEFSSIVVCGGGYGDLPRLLRRRNPHATIVVLDTPLNAALQWLYLSSVIGERAVRLVTDPGSERPDGYLYLSTTALAPALALRCEVFMAPITSHPEPATIVSALDLDCFGAQHFLIGFFDDATPFAAEVRARAAGVVALPGLEPKSLAFR
jgi:hypothetical protein